MSSSPLLMLSVDSFHPKHHGGGPPSKLSVGVTCSVLLASFFAYEHFFRWMLDVNKGLHPLLEDPANRNILARYAGFDSLSCAICVLLGWQTRHLMQPCWDALFMRPSKAKAHPREEPHSHPAAFRLCLFFFTYQLKDLYDTMVWNDGPEFIVHHIFSIITAWGGMYPGLCRVYSPFFFGISELSTVALCLLTPFNEEQSANGISGLGEAFPTLKLVLGISFVLLFLIVRSIIWPLVTLNTARYCCSSLRLLWKQLMRQTYTNSKEETTTTVLHKMWWHTFYLTSLSVISVLQIMWLFLILDKAKSELTQIYLE